MSQKGKLAVDLASQPISVTHRYLVAGVGTVLAVTAALALTLSV